MAFLKSPLRRGRGQRKNFSFEKCPPQHPNSSVFLLSREYPPPPPTTFVRGRGGMIYEGGSVSSAEEEMNILFLLSPPNTLVLSRLQKKERNCGTFSFFSSPSSADAISHPRTGRGKRRRKGTGGGRGGVRETLVCRHHALSRAAAISKLSNVRGLFDPLKDSLIDENW